MTSLSKSYVQFEAKKPSPLLAKAEDFLDRSFCWLVPAFFALVTLILFFDVLFLSKSGTVLSTPGHDITSLMYPLWSFAAHEIEHGHTPLWNPHIFSGTPFVGDFNTGIFYPGHWLIRWLPLATAINAILALDFFLAGYFAALWGRMRRLSTVGCLIAGMVFAFSGPLFLHLFPGHIPVVSCAVWIPLVFLAIDGLRRDAQFKWALVGGLAVGMQILTGFPQLVYYTAILAGIYTLLSLPGAKNWLRMGLFALTIYVIGPAMGAVQLLPGLQTADESARAGGNALPFAMMTALPPQNFLSVMTPNLFGDIMSMTPHAEPPPTDPTQQAMHLYWGAAFPWELSMFLGVTTVALALYGLCCGKRENRRWVILVLLILASILAMGRYLGPSSADAMARPDNQGHLYVGWWYYFLFNRLPLYASFRGVARFNIFIALFTGLLAGTGFDALKRSYLWGLPVLMLAACALFIGLGAYFSMAQKAPDMWTGLISYIHPPADVQVVPEGTFDAPAFANGTVKVIGHDLLVAGAILGTLGVLSIFRMYFFSVRYVVAGLLVVELFCFAAENRPSGSSQLGYPEGWKGMIDNIDPTYRVFTSSGLANQSMVASFNDVYGYDPVVLKRYAQILALNQGIPNDQLDQINFAMGLGRMPQQSSLSIYRLMRCQFIFAINNGQGITIDVPGPMHQLTLVPNIEVIEAPADEKSGDAPSTQLKLKTHEQRAREEMFDALTASDFEPTRTVLLESKPEGWTGSDSIPTKGPPLESGIAGTVELVHSTSDSLEIKADLPAPRILLVTDGYSRYWKARPLETGPQAKYEVLPADYAFRAIPLAAGKHHLVLEYKPDGFVAAKALSMATGLGAAGLCLWLAVAGRQKKQDASLPKPEVPAPAPNPA